MTKIIINKNLQQESDDSSQPISFAETQHQPWPSDFHYQEYTYYDSNSEKHIDHNPGGNFGGDDHPPVCPAPLTEYPGLTDYVSGSWQYILADNFDNLVLLPETPFQFTDADGNTFTLVISGDYWTTPFEPSIAKNLYGNAHDNIIVGNNYNDFIDGKLGQDTMIGGKGSDVYIVDNVQDVIIESVDEGTYDKVISSVNYSLADNVENLELSGQENINGFGNALNNQIKGNAGNNIIEGGAGNDALRGGLGADTLTGGSGNDTFIFSKQDMDGSGADIITDFVSGEDHIELTTLSGPITGLPFLDDKYTFVFGKGLSFTSGDGYTEARTEGPQFIYNSSTGDLYFDSDGVGGKDATHFVTLLNAPTLTAEDISFHHVYVPPCGVGDTTDYSFLIY